MGNRAAVAFTDKHNTKPTTYVYLHWNGGPESVYPMVDALRDAHRLGHSASYALAQFASLAVQFIGADGLSVGIERFATPCHAATTADDNGAYIFDIGTGCVSRHVRGGNTATGTRDLSADEIDDERMMAAKHRYADEGIRATFDAMLATKPEPKAA